MNQEYIQTIQKPGFFERAGSGIYFYLSFLVWPFLVLMAAFREYDRPWARNVFWMFCIFFGFIFIITRNDSFSADSSRIALLLTQYANSKMSLGDLWQSFYSAGSNQVDIIQPMLAFLVSRFTDKPSILFAIFGLIFGYFYSRNLWYILDRVKGKITLIVLLFIVTFALLNPIWHINGFRMWTASQVFLYGTMPYLLEGNRKKLIWSFVSVFFHFSFLLPIAILIIFIVARNQVHIYFIFFIITSFLKEIDLQAVSSALSFLPDLFQSRVNIYTNLDYAENVRNLNQNVNWYVPFSDKGIGWVTYALTIFIYFFGRKYLSQDSKTGLTELFGFSLLFYDFANIFSLIPSGGRFLVVAAVFMFVVFILFITRRPEIKGFELFKIMAVPFLLLFCIINFRVGTDYYGLMAFFGNPVVAALSADSVPLIAGIKDLIAF